MSARKLLTIEDVRDLLALRCKAVGSQAGFAAQHGLTRAYVGQVLNGKRPPSDKLCRSLGIRENGVRWVRE